MKFPENIPWSESGGDVRWLDLAPADQPFRSDYMIILITTLAARVPLELMQEAVRDTLRSMGFDPHSVDENSR